MKLTVRQFGWLAVGSLLITIGAGVSGVHSFAGQFWHVTAGFFLFFVGYRVAQLGLHPPSEGITATTVLIPGADPFSITGGLRLVAIPIGAIGIGWGVTQFSQTIVDPDLQRAIVAGVASIAGYILAHFGLMEMKL